MELTGLVGWRGMVGSVLLARRLAPKFGAWNASLMGAADYVVSMAVVFLLMPTIAETPGPITESGPTSTSSASLAAGSTTAVGWMRGKAAA